MRENVGSRSLYWHQEEWLVKQSGKRLRVYFKADKRAVRDRYNLLSKELRTKLKNEERESGIETDMTEWKSH